MFSTHLVNVIVIFSVMKYNTTSHPDINLLLVDNIGVICIKMCFFYGNFFSIHFLHLPYEFERFILTFWKLQCNSSRVRCWVSSRNRYSRIAIFVYGYNIIFTQPTKSQTKNLKNLNNVQLSINSLCIVCNGGCSPSTPGRLISWRCWYFILLRFVLYCIRNKLNKMTLC